MEIKLVEYSKTYLDKSWIWLNEPEIKTMTNTPDFTRDDQLAWYNKLPHVADYKIWGIEANSVPVGVCGLKKITGIDCEYWGYIGEKEYWGMSIGKFMVRELEARAAKMGLKSIWLQVLQSNHRAKKLYESFGYKVENKENNLIIMRKYILEKS